MKEEDHDPQAAPRRAPRDPPAAVAPDGKPRSWQWETLRAVIDASRAMRRVMQDYDTRRLHSRSWSFPNTGAIA